MIEMVNFALFLQLAQDNPPFAQLGGGSDPLV
jgi:hypothetical protein